MGEKRCPHCGKWSDWNQKLEDPCDHCGKPLGGEDLEHRNRDRQKAQERAESWIFYIREDDSDFVKFWKTVGNTFYIIYMSILSFFAWLIAALPG
ncbi:hypothetical protein [Litoribacter populi]|uniref:hypothetical protein n=1 Tax=Litoribacter populi TaxID=2598460 RepID=UPI001180FC06|nr:hypothetical protein [Litoribacter populi]